MSGQHIEQPVILSMEVDDEDAYESEYRVQIGSQVKYLVISPGTYERDTLSFPIESLPPLPYHEKWTVAHISRNKTSNDLEYTLTDQRLPGVNNQWHHLSIDCLSLEKTNLLTAMVFEAVLHSPVLTHHDSKPTVIAKIARFEWELPRIERETRAYQLLEGSGLAPRFLGHVHENGRIMGFILEKLEGSPASISHLSSCETAIGGLHRLGLLHGDVNRYNFLVTEEGVKLLDFEGSQENASPESMHKELESIRTKLTDESGRGGGFMFNDDDTLVASS